MKKQALQSVNHQIVVQQRIVSLRNVFYIKIKHFPLFEISDIWGACANCMQNVIGMTKRIWMECNYIKIKQFFYKKKFSKMKNVQRLRE